jgi:IclR family KDG regulon transcriptional repressor
MRQTNNVAFRKTVDKAMRVLHVFSVDEPELSIGELSARLAMHKSVVSRLVSELQEWRMLEKDPATRRVRIGAGAFRLGALFAHRDNLVRIATPLLGELVNHTGHSAHLSIVDGIRMLVIATVESPSALRVIMRVGDHRDLYTTAAGKLFLALNDEHLLDAVIRETGLQARTPQTVTSRRELQTLLTRVRREGVAWNRGESSSGAGAVAAPVFNASGNMVAAVSTVYPLQVVDAAAREQLGEKTVAAARRITQQLDHTRKP